MALTAKGRATRQRIIEGAAQYLRSDDPGEVTLDDIRAITGTSKSQIFHYFPAGKEELLLEVARYESRRVLDDQQPHLGGLTSWAAWSRWRDAVVARYRAQGRNCPLGALMAQSAARRRRRGRHHAPRAVAGARLRRHRGDAGRGPRPPGTRPDRVSAAFIAGIQGGVQVLRSTGSTWHLEATLDALIDHLRGV